MNIGKIVRTRMPIAPHPLQPTFNMMKDCEKRLTFTNISSRIKTLIRALSYYGTAV